MSKLKAPRGCPDLLPEDNAKIDIIISKAKRWAQIYGYETYKTPIFESAEVFTKTLGDQSDIVTKEMYSFQDKKGETFVLRPEATAPLVRLFVSEKLQRSTPLRMFTYGPMFRYERPQKGRQRQFHQIGVEYIGAPKNLFTHFEVISMGWNFLQALEISAPLKVKVNGLGNSDERAAFKKALTDYLQPLKEKLSEESQKRLKDNPLRILDSKSKEDQALLQNAPQLRGFVSSDSQKDLDELISLCKSEGIHIEHDPLLVRGIDYYNDLVFEMIAESDLGSQNTVLAGGRYDQLIESMGGGKFEALGWGAGLERLMILSKLKAKARPSLGLVFMNKDQHLFAQISNSIRKKGKSLFAPTSGNFSKRLQKCQKAGCNEVLILGEDELQKNLWTLKNLESGEQKEISPADFLESL